MEPSCRFGQFVLFARMAGDFSFRNSQSRAHLTNGQAGAVFFVDGLVDGIRVSNALRLGARGVPNPPILLNFRSVWRILF